MKKCPTCSKTFEDSMRFCQTDGTPLIDDEPAFDPYSTIVAPKAEIMAQMEADAAAEASSDSASDPEPAYEDPAPIAEPDDVLDLPTPDPLKTMYASDAELREVLAARDEPESDVLDVPESSTSDSFAAYDEPGIPTPFGAPEPPPSPFAETEQPVYAPEPGNYDEPVTVIQSGSVNPFDVPPAAPVEQWTPPPSPQPAWQEQGADVAGSFQQSSATASENQNKTLAIVSLVSGILGLTLCCGTLLPSFIAIVAGFMARGKASSDPANYGGAGMALGGLITGILGLLIGVAYLIFMFLLGGLQMVSQSGF